MDYAQQFRGTSCFCDRHYFRGIHSEAHGRSTQRLYKEISFPLKRAGLRVAAVLIVAMMLAATTSVDATWAQGNSGAGRAAGSGVALGIVRGTVTDPSGAGVAGATVTAVPATGESASATTNAQGAYEIRGLAPGAYEIKASAASFQDHSQQNVTITAGAAQSVDISLELAVERQQIQVSGSAPNLEVSPDKNAGAVEIKGNDLDALSDDPDQLAQDLQNLAGPAAGPNGGQTFVNGFTSGQLPPKSSIREIRVNKNPFSSEFDQPGFGRIEILTKPGTSQLHGDAFASGSDQALNTWNPFVPVSQHLGYYSVQGGGDLSGSLNKKTSFSLSYYRRFINQLELGAIQDPNTFETTPGALSVLNPRTRSSYGGNVDYQLTPNNTLTAYYQYWRNDEKNDGISQYSLPEQAYNSISYEHQIQITDSQILSPSVANETRFQYLRDHSENMPLSLAFAYSAPGTVNGGGNTAGHTRDTLNRLELQNYTTMVKGRHTMRFGARLRNATDSNDSLANGNGSFAFASAAAYQGALQAAKQGTAVPAADYPIAFTLGAGAPHESANLFDGGIFAQDDFQWRRNITFSAGFRFETQTGSPDAADYAPRLAVAWGIGKTKTDTPRSVVRAGWGIFYNRFPMGNLLNSERFDGVTQVTYSVLNPNFFPTIPTPAALAGSSSLPTVYKIAPTLHSPYTMQTALTLEQQVFHGMSLTLNYVNTRGVHQFYSANVNTPLPGTFDANNPAAAAYPFGYSAGYINQYLSGGIFRQNQLVVNFNGKVGKHLSLWSYYALNYASGTTGGLLSDYYNPGLDYGRAGFDIRHRANVGGSITVKYGFEISPYISFVSGQPFNITSGNNLFGTSAGAGGSRPSFTNLPIGTPGVYATPWGNVFDGLPAAGETTIPINLGTGPSQFIANMGLSKAFAFGPPREAASSSGAAGASGPTATPSGGAAKKAPGRYTMRLGIYSRNIFNQRNYANPVGVVSSNSFLKSVSLMNQGPANRQVYLNASFNF